MTRAAHPIAVILAVGLVAVVGGGCANGSGSDRSGPVSSVSVTSGDPLLEGVAVEPSVPNLPTIVDGGSDMVVVPTTTSTTAPTTTTTVPPPVIPSDVLFDTNRADLKPEADPYLADLATQISQRHPGARLSFVGHTDSRGVEEFNQDLSLRRAVAVLNWFAAHGFDRGLLTAEGAGESRPLVNDVRGDGSFDEDAGRQNRRVEIIIG